MCTLFEMMSKNRLLQHKDKDGTVPNASRENWLLWCRLCAKEDPTENVSILLKNEQQHCHIMTATTSLKNGTSLEDNVPAMDLSLESSIQKYFSVQITCDDKLPKMLCTECFSLITSLVNFSERVANVQQMLLELKDNFESSKVMNIQAIRLKYGLLDEDRKHVLIHQPVPEIHYLETAMTTKTLSASNSTSEVYQPDASRIMNPLEQPRIKLIIKKENISEELANDGINKYCSVYNDSQSDNNDEYPFDNDSDAMNNLDESFVDVLSLPTKAGSECSEHSIQLNNCNKKETKRNLSRTKRTGIKDTLKKDASRKSRRRRHSSSEKDNANDSKNKEGTESSSEAIPCTECPRKFKRTQSLRYHLSRTHSIKLPELEFSCPQCSRIFKSQYKLKRHMTTHLPDEERKILPCSYCDKKFSTKFLVQVHIKHVHMDERPFVCDKCGIAVRTIVALKEHQLTHTDYAPFKCEVCGKCYKDKYRLKYHMEIHTPKKHICTVCGLQLNSRATLNRHMLVHSDVLRHKCDYCGRAFKRVKTLKTHLILHTGLKPYSCNFCDRTFASGANCRSHKKKAHPEQLAALEATGGGKAYTRNIPTLETLKAITRTADNLAPVVSKPSGCFQYRKKPKPLTTTITKNDETVLETTLNTSRENDLDQFLPTIT